MSTPNPDPPGTPTEGKPLEATKSTTASSVTTEREEWGHGLHFLMSCIAMSVGLGNVWRFSFTAYENGGGAFLIPYIILLTLVGRPLYYMEMGLGQFGNRGNVMLFEALSPYLKGVGYAQAVGAGCVATYYCSLMATALFYLFNSFTGDLPWSRCREKWDEYLESHDKGCLPATVTGKNEAEYNNSLSSSELFFTQDVLREYEDITYGIGKPEWRLSLCLLFSWIATWLVTARGVKSSGKAAYFLAIFPYVVMIALLIKAATLKGSGEGMYYFIKTDWSKLLEPDVWYAAVTQCFFSLNVGFGSIVMFSSYNNFRHNINRDALIVTTLDTVTSLLCGITMFGILGNLAHNLGVTPDKVIKSGGTGLAFISYPDAIAKFKAVPWLFAILFFVMLFVLGVGSLVAFHGTVNTVIEDHFPETRKWIISGVTALLGFFIGLMYVTPGGQYMLTLVDHFGGTFIIIVFVIIESTGVAWVYGLENFCLDMEYMLKHKVGFYWRFTWGIITPVLLIVIFCYFCAKLKRLTYGEFQYPNGVLAFGWCILIVTVVQFLLWILVYIYRHRRYGCRTATKKAFQNKDWRPNSEYHYEGWKMFKEEALTASDAKQRNWMKKHCDFLFGR